MILDEEVFAVILAITVVASVFASAMILRPTSYEPFIAIGLLNEECKIGEYPKIIYVHENVTLCIFIGNYMHRPVYYKVVFKIANASTLPTNTTPAPTKPLKEWTGFLNDNSNTTFKIHIVIDKPPPYRNATLVFELWTYDIEKDEWVYTGRWTHLHVEIRELGVIP